MEADDIKELNSKLTELNKLTRAQVSMSKVFIRGLVTGAGTAIGATIIAGILLAALGTVLRSSQSVPLFDSLIKEITESQQRAGEIIDNK